MIISGILASVCLAVILTPQRMGPLALLFGIVVTVFVSRVVRNTRGRKMGEERARTSWPVQWSSLLRGYDEAVRSHQSRLQEASVRWNADENARVSWAKRLIGDDVEVLNKSVGDTLSNLAFPFETQCQVAVADAHTAYVLLDLPEIEHVVPETRQQVLKDGRLRELGRSKQERQLDYAHLVAGLALMLARAGLTAGPTVATMYIAAYTQRRQSRTGVVRDDFVYDVKVDRGVAAEWDPARVDALAVLTQLPGRIDFRTGNDLKTIDPPTWAGELLSP